MYPDELIDRQEELMREKKMFNLCPACREEMQDNQRRKCTLDECKHDGCINCMVYSKDYAEWFCDTGGNKDIRDSECYQKFREAVEIEND